MSILIPTSIPVRSPPLEDRIEHWKGAQGAAWVRRNPATVEALDASYLERFGITRTDVNRELLSDVPITATVLEVGCSAGRQLDALAAIGFTHLQGLDLSPDAVAECKWPATVGDGMQIPLPDQSVDMVMTSGTFMQIPWRHKLGFMNEMQRVARRWIYGVEMWTEAETVWDFGDLMPPAWTYDWFARLPSGGWPIVKRRMLHGPRISPLAAYLLQKPE